MSTVFALALGLGLAFGLSYVFADSTNGGFTPPTDTFPNCDPSVPACNTPINVGTKEQVKNGSLSVNAFTAYMDSEFYQGLTVDQLADGAEHYVCVDGSGKFVMCSGTVHVSPAAYDQTLYVTGIPGFNQPAGGTNTTYDGSHSTGFTAAIQVQVTDGSSTPPSTNIQVTDNGTVVGCVPVPTTTPATLTFPSATYGIFDSIGISANLGGC